MLSTGPASQNKKFLDNLIFSSCSVFSIPLSLSFTLATSQSSFPHHESTKRSQAIAESEGSLSVGSELSTPGGYPERTRWRKKQFGGNPMQTLSRNLICKLARVVIPCVVAAALIFPALRTQAQSSSSGVNGVVTDQNGAVVSGAKVVLVNVATNVERATVSNGSGNYFFAEVPPARYMLIFTAVGFQKETIAGFDVDVAQVVTINASLKVGSVQQSVTVQAENTEVESSSAQLGSVIGTQQVNDLPLDGRNFTQLLDLTPGVTPISTGQNSSAGNVATIAPEPPGRR